MALPSSPSGPYLRKLVPSSYTIAEIRARRETGPAIASSGSQAPSSRNGRVRQAHREASPSEGGDIATGWPK